MRGRCAHLEGYRNPPSQAVLPDTHPTFSQALSALVKAIRIRRADVATYWLVYLNSPRFGDRETEFRVARRLLQATAEDGF